ncbi:MAG: phenylalanine--tRNA ligase subunit beta [Chloroflexi bacterium]|nr:phenylalanine--tRNA ligase subunit beta [Chloroflexota bacterium]
MKVSLKWLRDYIEIASTPAEIAGMLTMAGIEVKDLHIIGGKWDNIVVGQLIDVAPHPNADRLRLTTVDLGTEKLCVVNGAPNLGIGDKVAFARVGAEFIDPHGGQVQRLKAAKIRGVESHGMVCSEMELGISNNHEGIMILPADAPVGTSLAKYLGDTVLDMEVTPNRADCLSVIGIAREVAALSGKSVRLPAVDYREAASPIEQSVSVEIAAPDLCPRYCASLVTGVKIAESPKWMQQRLIACGMRPINNIVDITNYVMLEYGQPLHAFDYEMLRGKKIIVRRAGNGEKITSLDGVERVLSGDMLVIADAERAVAVAGVMGGANSEVTEQTTSILLEAASFNPASIHHTGSTLRMPSEACMRFERAIRAELAPLALKRATQLFLELAGGEAAKGVIDVYPGKVERQPIPVSLSEVKRILGVEFSLNHVTQALTALGFDCQKGGSPSEIRVTAPYWRGDIRLKVDVIEEVARVIGYDKIPMTLLGEPLPGQNPVPVIGLKQKICRSLAGYGFHEGVTYSLASLELLTRLIPEPHPLEPPPVRLDNPMSAEQEYLRTSLRANLLVAFAANRRHEDGGIRLFEAGKVYLPHRKELPEEREMVCGVMGGSRFDASWHGNNESLDFYDAKGIVEALLGHLGIDATFEKGADEGLHPGRQAAIVKGDTKLGIVGEVHPRVAQAFEIAESVYLLELNLAALLPFATVDRVFHPVPRFPSVVRDIALIVDAGVSHRQVHDIIRSFSLVTEAKVFDVYSGEQVPPGKASLAYRLVYQSPSHTLTDDDVNKVQEKILARLSRELGATLRV